MPLKLPLKQLRYLPLLAAGVLVFLGLVLLGNLSGLRWHSRTFGWWGPLNPTILGPTGDWAAWVASLLLTISPSVVPRAGGRTRWDTALVVVSFFVPLLSLMTMTWSQSFSGELLVGFGFLAAYALTSRSQTLLGVEKGTAGRIVCSEVFAFLAIAAAGGAASVLLWQKGVFYALTSGSNGGPLFTCLTVDMEIFYLTRPVLLALFIALGLVAFIALFRENFQSVARPVIRRLMRDKPVAADYESSRFVSQPGRRVMIRAGFPYLILAGSVALGIAITIYPYTVANVGMVLGSDMWFYYERLRVMMAAPNPLLALEGDRGLFVLTLFLIMNLVHLDIQWVLILAPALCSTLLALSTFALVREGTGRPWLAGFAALLSVVSAQTSLGMGAGILANWFSLSLLNFMFALMLRWVRLRSKLAGVGSLLVSLVLLGSYTYTWVAAVGMLAVALVATIFSYRRRTRHLWRHELIAFGAALVGVFALPAVLGYVVMIPLLGYVPSWFNPFAWASMGSNYLVGRPFSEALALAPSALEEAFDFAGNRVDLPFLTILSIVGLADSAWSGSFRRLVAAMMLVPIVLAAVSPDLYLTWRGLYMIPMYLTGALGVGSIVGRVNGQGAPWRSLSRLTFAGTFAGYVFLAHLSYSLRALWLLILVASRW